MAIAEPHLKVQRIPSDILVGQGPDGLLLRGDYSPRSVLSGELTLKKNDKQKVTMEISEKFIAVWTRKENTKTLKIEGVNVYILNRANASIWFGKGTDGEVRIDGRTYAKTEKEYDKLNQEMSKSLSDLFYIYPENIEILRSMQEVSGKPEESLARFMKVLVGFLG